MCSENHKNDNQTIWWKFSTLDTQRYPKGKFYSRTQITRLTSSWNCWFVIPEEFLRLRHSNPLIVFVLYLLENNFKNLLCRFLWGWSYKNLFTFFTTPQQFTLNQNVLSFSCLKLKCLIMRKFLIDDDLGKTSGWNYEKGFSESDKKMFHWKLRKATMDTLGE